MTSETPRTEPLPVDESFVIETLRVLGVIEHASEARVSPLAGGASNENFLVETAGDRWVLRIASSLRLAERFSLDRWRGFTAHQTAARRGVAPELAAVALPSGHSVVAFVDGTVLTPETFLEGSDLEDAVLALRTVHAAPPPECGRFSGLAEVERFLRIAEEESLALPEDIAELYALSRDIERVFDEVRVPEVLCHNDVQIANLIRGADGRLWLIDWEYGGLGNPYFDLAMLVNNASLGDSEIDRMLTAYFGQVREADRARVALQCFQAAMREAMWSIAAAPVLPTDWDFEAWAEHFFDIARGARDVIRNRQSLSAAGADGADALLFERLVGHEG